MQVMSHGVGILSLSLNQCGCVCMCVFLCFAFMRVVVYVNGVLGECGDLVPPLSLLRHRNQADHVLPVPVLRALCLFVCVWSVCVCVCGSMNDISHLSGCVCL